MTLTWHNARDAGQLVSRDQVPPDDDIPVGPFYSQPVLLTDYKQYDGDTNDDCFAISGTKIGGHSQFYGDNWLPCFSRLKDPVFLCSAGATWDGSLPAMDGFEQTRPGELAWPGMAVLVIVYPKGDPSDLHWIAYMP